MRIAICDDKMILHDDLKNCLEQYASAHGIVNVYDDFTEGKELIASERSYDLIFMDYQMDGLDGLETSRRLRKASVDTPIIFLTSFPDIVFDTFEVGAYRFLVKPIDYEKLSSALDSLLEEMGAEQRYIVMKTEGESIRVSVDDILYAEAADKYCYVRTTEDSIKFGGTLSDFEKLLPEDCFYRTHRSYIVNFRHIKSHTSDEVLFDNNERAVISRTKSAAFKKAFLAYVKRGREGR